MVNKYVLGNNEQLAISLADYGGRSFRDSASHKSYFAEDLAGFQS